MKFMLGVIIVLLALSTACTAGYSSQGERPSLGTEADARITSLKKGTYDLAMDFVHSLKKTGVDTAMFYKRTCINCCDFYNVFWTIKGQAFLKKFHEDYDYQVLRPDTIRLSSNKLFSELTSNYTVLKTERIRQAEHKLKDGTTSMSFMDHYCYTRLNIYAAKDSIITGQIKDSDFDRYVGYSVDPKQEHETNDHYAANINSKWNSLLTLIEQQLSIMSTTNQRELNTLRMTKSNR